MKYNSYYQSNIKTSRQEDGVYAMRYASQQMLIDKLQKKLEEYENMRKEAIEYMKEFTFERLLVQEDRKLIMYNENLKNFENILNKVGDSNE